MIEITSSPIDHASLTERVRAAHAGAVCTFLGTVRDLTGDRQTVSLEYEAYGEMALKKLAELESEARRRWPIIDLRSCIVRASLTRARLALSWRSARRTAIKRSKHADG